MPLNLPVRGPAQPGHQGQAADESQGDREDGKYLIHPVPVIKDTSTFQLVLSLMILPNLD